MVDPHESAARNVLPNQTIVLADDNRGDNRGRKRKRFDSESTPLPIEERMESLVVKLGDKTSTSLEKSLEDAAAVLNEDAARYKANIIKVICEWCVSIPDPGLTCPQIA